MAYDDYKAGCLVIKEYVDTAIGNIAQPSSLPQTYKKKAVTLATSGWTSKSIELVPTNREIYFAASPRVGETITPPSDINPADIQQFECVVGGSKQTVSFMFFSSNDDEIRWKGIRVSSGTTYNLIIRYRKSVNYSGGENGRNNRLKGIFLYIKEKNVANRFISNYLWTYKWTS